MPLSFPPTLSQAQNALQLLGVHLHFHDPDYLTTVPAAVAALYPNLQQVHMVARTATNRAYYLAISNNTQFIVFVEGIEPNQFPGIAVRAGSPTDTGSGWNALPDAWSDVLRIEDTMETMRPGLVTSVQASGFSIGGAVCANLLIDMIGGVAGFPNLPASSMTMTNFGNPKPFNGPGRNLSRAINTISWYGFDDPVPLIPPNNAVLTHLASYLPNIAGALLALLGSNYTTYVHETGGVVINTNGQVTNFEDEYQWQLWINAELVFWVALANAIVTGSTAPLHGVASGHEVVRYVERIERYVQNLQNNNPVVEGDWSGGVGVVDLNQDTTNNFVVNSVTTNLNNTNEAGASIAERVSMSYSPPQFPYITLNFRDNCTGLTANETYIYRNDTAPLSTVQTAGGQLYDARQQLQPQNVILQAFATGYLNVPKSRIVTAYGANLVGTPQDQGTIPDVASMLIRQYSNAVVGPPAQPAHTANKYLFGVPLVQGNVGGCYNVKLDDFSDSAWTTKFNAFVALLKQQWNFKALDESPQTNPKIQVVNVTLNPSNASAFPNQMVVTISGTSPFAIGQKVIWGGTKSNNCLNGVYTVDASSSSGGYSMLTLGPATRMGPICFQNPTKSSMNSNPRGHLSLVQFISSPINNVQMIRMTGHQRGQGSLLNKRGKRRGRCVQVCQTSIPVQCLGACSV